MFKKKDGAPKEKGTGRVKAFLDRFSMRAKATVCVVLVVCVAAGAGLLVWHEQPSFCTAICHEPMADAYLDTYKAEPGTVSTDKWGNEVEDAHAMLSSVHRASYGVTCLECHEPTLAQQMGEGLLKITNGYEFPLPERNTAKLATVHGAVGDTFCLNSSCHNMTREDLKAATSHLKFNPHDDVHNLALDCSDCHKAHRASVYYCTQCHEDSTIKLPVGWLTYEQDQQLQASFKGVEVPATQISKVTASTSR